jgi:uncharacterized protein YndB with AHSA1/START domain
MGREFEVRREVELSATPEQVWEAVSTEAGLASWLFPESVAPYGEEGSPIQVWDPPNRLVVRQEFPGGGFNALEFTIEGRGGGSAALRYVHSGIFDDESWDDQYDAVSQHTDFYLHTLGQYLGVESASEGDQVNLDLGAAGRIDGTIDYNRGNFLGIRTSDGMYRFFGRNAFGGPVGVVLHDFGGRDTDQAKRALQSWLDRVYA